MQFQKIHNFEINWSILNLPTNWISENAFKPGNFCFIILAYLNLKKKRGGGKGKRYGATNCWFFFAVLVSKRERNFSGIKLKYKIFFVVLLDLIIKGDRFPLASVWKSNLMWAFRMKILNLILFSWKLMPTLFVAFQLLICFWLGRQLAVLTSYLEECIIFFFFATYTCCFLFRSY